MPDPVTTPVEPVAPVTPETPAAPAPVLPLSENKEAQAALSGETPAPKAPGTPEPSKDGAPVKEDDTAGVHKRIGSLWGKYKGAERENERKSTEIVELQKQVDEFKTWKEQTQSDQKAQNDEFKNAQFKKDYAAAVEEGDGDKAAELLTEFQATAVPKPEVKPPVEQPTESRGMAAFIKKYESVIEDENFIQLAHKVDKEYKEKYANELASGVLNNDGFIMLVDREVETQLKASSDALGNFSAVGGVTPNGAAPSSTPVELTAAQKGIAARLFQDGIAPSLEAAYSQYAKALGGK